MTRGLALLSMLALAGAGCAALGNQPGAAEREASAAPPPGYTELDERGKFGARSVVELAPTAGQPLPVYTLEDLPEGFFVGPDRNSVKAEKDFPTPPSSCAPRSPPRCR